MNWLAALGFFALVLTLSHFLPLMQDEAYYATWAQSLQWGYYDHPPMVAWIGALSKALASLLGMNPQSAAGLRLVSNGLGATLFVVMVSCCRTLAADGKSKGLSLWPVGGCLAPIVGGVLLTPDIGLLLFVAAAFHETLLALKNHPVRWLSAGLFLGLAVLSKYTAGIVVLGPLVWLLAATLRQENRKALKTGFAKHAPYVAGGALFFFLTILPHLAWLSQNDWVSLRVQLNHGFSGKVGASAENEPRGAALQTNFCPIPQTPDIDSREYQWGSAFIHLQESLDLQAGRKDLKPKAEMPAAVKIMTHLGEVLAAVAAVWGALLIPLGVSFCRGRRPKLSAVATTAQSQKPTLVQTYCGVFAAGPIVFFLFTALFAKVEANWPMIYVIGALPLVASLLSDQRRGLRLAALFNGILLLSFVVRPSFFPDRWYVRIDKEHHGLGELLATISSRAATPILVDSYQLVSHLNTMGAKNLAQWNQLSRSSEFTRPGQALFGLCGSGFDAVQDFTYVGTEAPPAAPGFVLTELRQVRDCLAVGAEVLTQEEVKEGSGFMPKCDDPVHGWFVGSYRRSF